MSYEGEGLDKYRIAEAILDADLYAHEILPPTINATYSQVDIRQYACDVALRSITHVREGTAQDGHKSVYDVPDTAEMTAARRLILPYAPRILEKINQAHYLHGARSKLVLEQCDEPGLQARADFQHEVIGSIWEQMQKVRVQRSNPYDIDQTLQNGIVVVAPPGAGKTYVASKVLEMCSVGSKVFPGDTRPQSALIAVPSLKLVEQYMSDGPRNMFRQLLGWDMPVGEYHGYKKQQEAVTLITQHSLRLAVQRGEIKRGDYDYLVFDEVHHLSAKENFNTMRQIGGSVIGLTASPIYSAKRDLHQWFAHEGGGNFAEFIHAGILNPVELASYDVENLKHAAVVGAKLAAGWIREGLRVAVYCIAGQECAQAKSVAEIINDELGEEQVRPLGRYKGNTTDADLERFSKGELSGLVLTSMLKEGWDDDIDGAIIIGQRFSMVDVIQISGRISRLSSKRSRLAEIVAGGEDPKRASIWQALGLEPIRQGARLLGDTPSNIGGEGEAIHAEAVPDDADRLLPVQSPRKQMVISSASGPTAAPEGMVSVDLLAEEFNTTPEYLRTIVARTGAAEYVQSFRSQPGQNQKYWASAKFRKYLEEHPPLQVGYGARGNEELCLELSLPGPAIHWAAKECGVRRELLLDPVTGEDRRIFTAESAKKIIEFIGNIPFAEDDDVPQAILVAEVGSEFAAQISQKFAIRTHNKRLRQVGSIRGIKQHFNAQDAQIIRQEYTRIVGGAEDEVVSQKRLPGYLVTHTAVRRRFEIDDGELSALIEEARGDSRTLHLKSGGTLPCMSWQTLQAIEHQRLATDRLGRIEYERLPTGPDDDDPIRGMYATIVRAFYGQVAAGDAYIDCAEAAAALSITKPALHHFVRRSEIEQMDGDDTVQMSALTRILPEVAEFKILPKSYISAQQLIRRYTTSPVNRGSVTALVMRLARISPTPVKYGRADVDDVGDIYFSRAQIIPYVERELQKLQSP